MIGCVFPGQGSQSVGMLNEIAIEFPDVKNYFQRASLVLGYDLWTLTQEGPAEKLDQTIYTQPALLVASFAIWQIIKNKSQIQPSLFAGHSLGEYTALACAGAISFDDAVKLVSARGQFMQDAVPSGVGALAAIVGLKDEDVKNLCETTRKNDEVLTPVNFNSPGQVVVGGHLEAVERALSEAKAFGAKLAKKLPVSVPSHCVLMLPAAERLAQLLNEISISSPQIPVLNNVDVKLYTSEESIRDGLKRQLYLPVRWVETTQYFAKAGIKTVIECGPGKVLSGLNKRIVPEFSLLNTADLPALQNLLETVF